MLGFGMSFCAKCESIIGVLDNIPCFIIGKPKEKVAGVIVLIEPGTPYFSFARCVICLLFCQSCYTKLSKGEIDKIAKRELAKPDPITLKEWDKIWEEKLSEV